MTDHPSDIVLPYGLSPDGRMVHIANVPSGLACNCICAECHKRLVAKKGDIIRHHFAHEADADCASGYETMAHMLAKQVIADEKRIFIPAAIAVAGGMQRVVTKRQWIKFDTVNLEVWKNGLRPDIIGKLRDRELAIEIFVTHRCGPEKIAELRARKCSSIEIYLGDIRDISDVNEFWQMVLFKAPRYWIFNPRLDAARIELEAERVRLEERHYLQMIKVARVQAELEDDIWKEAQRIKEERTREIEERKLEWQRLKPERESRLRALAESFAIAEEQDARERLERQRVKKQADDLKISEFKTAIIIAARSWLGVECAHEWMATSIFHPYSGTTPAPNDIISVNDIPYHWNRLKAARDKLEYAATLKEEASKKLWSVALQHFKDTDRAELWIRTSNPALSMRRPYKVAVDPEGLTQCVRLLK